MSKAPETRFTESVNNFGTSNSNTGVVGVIGLTQRGPLGKADELITSWPQFQAWYGGEIAASEFPTLCRRILEGGGAIRVSSVKNRSNINDPATITATKSVAMANVKVVLSAALVVGQIITFDPWDGEDFSTSQAFSGNATSTLNAFLSKLKSVYTDYIADYALVNSTTFVLIPKPGVATADFKITVGGTGTLPDATLTDITLGDDAAGSLLFTLAPKYYGDCSKLVVEVSASSNGSPYSFNLKVWMRDFPNYVETYRNIQIQKVAANAANYLSEVEKTSKLVTPTYTDLSEYVDYPMPQFGTWHFKDGSIGNALTDADRVGIKSERSGIYAFDGVNDIIDLSYLTAVSNIAAQALESYAVSKGDITALHTIDHNITDPNAIITAKQSLGLTSSHSVIFTGGLTVVDSLAPNTTPPTGRHISELGDVLANSATSAVEEGAWKSPSGTRRGVIRNALAVKNPHLAEYSALLAQHQINIVKQEDGVKYMWHSFTAHQGNDALQFWNVRRMLNELKKTLKPIVHSYIEEPCDIPTWRLLYQEVKPILQERITKRALFDAEWRGDQFAKDLSSLTTNNESDVRLGKYKVKLRVKEIVSMQEIEIEINLSPAGVEFSESVLNNQ